jgi:hypothetical protein
MARLKLRRPASLKALAKLVSDPRRPADSAHLALALWGFGRVGWRDEELLMAVGHRLAGERDRLYLRPWSMAAALRTYAVQGVRHDALAAAVAEVRGAPRRGGLGGGAGGARRRGARLRLRLRPQGSMRSG